MGRAWKLLLAGALATVFGAAAASPVYGQRAPATTTRPTSTRQTSTTTTGSPADVDEVAKRYGLLRSADLPDGYAHDELDRDDGARPSFPSVFGECDGIKNNTWSGPLPVTTGGSFVEKRSDGSTGSTGAEIVRSFSSDSSSRAYFRSFAEGLAEMADCELMTSPNGAIGTYADLDVGKVGDERAAVAFDPRAGELQRISIARSGKRFVYVELNDDDVTDGEFRTLVKTAQKRATA